MQCSASGGGSRRTRFLTIVSISVLSTRRLDPIWTVKTKSLFLLEVDAAELFLSEGLLCILYDFDKVGKNEKLGAITIPPKTLYEAKGERMEFKLGPSPGETKDVPGYLAIRCRRATEYDANFMTDSAKGADSDLLGLKAATSKALHTKGGASNLQSMLNRNSKVFKDGINGKNAGIKHVSNISFFCSSIPVKCHN
jgi:hypothetical protein